MAPMRGSRRCCGGIRAAQAARSARPLRRARRCLPPLETLRSFLPPGDRWPIGHTWNFHAGRPHSTFDTFRWTTQAINRRYGKATGLTDYSRMAELQNYETARSFFEAWNVHEYDG